MPKRSRKQKDPFQMARAVLDAVVPDAEPKKKRTAKKAAPPKNAAAVAHGRLGGLKGGPARAAKLTKKQLSESARKAARARWQAERD